jgi:hypothetical protein
MNGDGVFSTLKQIHNQTPVGRLGLFLSGPRNHKSYRLNKFLEKHSNNEVTSVQIGKKPIISAVSKALNILSLGGYNKAKKSLGYDDVYHNYLIVGLNDGHFYKIEKNHQIEETKARQADFKNKMYNVEIPKDKKLSIKSMIDNASKDDPNFYKYSGLKKNCQDFTKSMIEKNGLIAEDPKILDNQRVDILLAGIPRPFSNIPQFVTDIAGAADRATSMIADGVNKKKRKKRKL